MLYIYLHMQIIKIFFKFGFTRVQIFMNSTSRLNLRNRHHLCEELLGWIELFPSYVTSEVDHYFSSFFSNTCVTETCIITIILFV